MEYKRFGNNVVVRMDVGDEILTSLKEVCLKENIKLASLTALGACNHFVAGVYDVEKKAYFKNEFNGAYEITALVGNISTKDGEYYAHLHITCGDDKGNCFGGHLNEATISVTCEMFINVIDGEVDRKVDEVTGLNVFKF